MTRNTDYTRRGALALAAGALALGAAGPAAALSTADAESFVNGMIADLRKLIDDDKKGEEGAAEFLSLLDRKTALAQVASFALGRTWRDMSETQRAAYQQAFRRYISRTYQKRFGEYSGEDIRVTGSTDAGQKGVLVKSQVIRPSQQPVELDWLVNDRSGKTLLADIVFEGVSLAITLRENFGGMIETRKGDVDLFISDLAGSEGA